MKSLQIEKSKYDPSLTGGFLARISSRFFVGMAVRAAKAEGGRHFILKGAI
jgi:hypothetical protein